MVVHHVVFQLLSHLGVGMAVLVLLDVDGGQRFGSTEQPVIQSGEYVTLKQARKLSLENMAYCYG